MYTKHDLGLEEINSALGDKWSAYPAASPNFSSYEEPRYSGIKPSRDGRIGYPSNKVIDVPEVKPHKVVRRALTDIINDISGNAYCYHRSPPHRIDGELARILDNMSNEESETPTAQIVTGIKHKFMRAYSDIEEWKYVKFRNIAKQTYTDPLKSHRSGLGYEIDDMIDGTYIGLVQAIAESITKIAETGLGTDPVINYLKSLRRRTWITHDLRKLEEMAKVR